MVGNEVEKGAPAPDFCFDFDGAGAKEVKCQICGKKMLGLLKEVKDKEEAKRIKEQCKKEWGVDVEARYFEMHNKKYVKVDPVKQETFYWTFTKGLVCEKCLNKMDEEESDINATMKGLIDLHLVV